jgi:cytochrome c oxidase cbb3-type subunit III
MNDPTSSASRRARKPRRWLRGATLLAGLLLAPVAAFSAGHARSSAAQLLRVTPDDITHDPALVRLAMAPGRAAFESHCAGCHGRDLKADRTKGVPNLADSEWLYGTGYVSEIQQTLRYGIRSGSPQAWNFATMPAFGMPHPSPDPDEDLPQLQPAAINDVIEYLFWLEKRPADMTAARRGEKVYQETAGCFDCHQPAGDGDPGIGAPSLADDIWLYGDGSRQALYESIFNERAGVCPAWIDRLSPLSIRESAVYINAVAHGPQSGAPAAARCKDMTMRPPQTSGYDIRVG